MTKKQLTFQMFGFPLVKLKAIIFCFCFLSGAGSYDFLMPNTGTKCRDIGLSHPATAFVFVICYIVLVDDVIVSTLHQETIANRLLGVPWKSSFKKEVAICAESCSVERPFSYFGTYIDSISWYANVIIFLLVIPVYFFPMQAKILAIYTVLKEFINAITVLRDKDGVQETS